MKTIIQRRLNFEGKKYWVTTNSFIEGETWFNCLYIHYRKEDFPWIKGPVLTEKDFWGTPRKTFDYHDCDIAKLDWHGGITFYEETLCIEPGVILVKAGCDYQHLGDDAYEEGDHGGYILSGDGVRIAKEFEELSDRLKSEYEKVE